MKDQRLYFRISEDDKKFIRKVARRHFQSEISQVVQHMIGKLRKEFKKSGDRIVEKQTE